ncbi:ribonuclease H-like domain-containing protein, partial [Tanacetum coccineum]
YKGGYVAFGNDPKGGRITGKGTIKTSCIDFENVSYVKELKFNLLSVSQICDKKHNVLFTDTECLILSPEFKIVDENLVLLRAPRKNDVYSLNLKSINPSGGVTYFVAQMIGARELQEYQQIEAFSDSDYAGDNHDRRSTSGGCQYLGRRLVSWQCKKQTIVAISSTEAEYVAAASCCGHLSPSC